LLIDIDCPWIEGSKYAAIAIINVFKKKRNNFVSVKFSVQKDFIFLFLWSFSRRNIWRANKKSFSFSSKKTVAYLRFEAGKELEKIIPEEFLKSIFKHIQFKRGIKCNHCGKSPENTN
jgi:hypothetical protein